MLGISKDKDIKGICNALCPLADTIILTEANNPRAAEAGFIERVIKGQKQDRGVLLLKTAGVKEAKAKALSIAKSNDLVLACGSLFVVGEFKYA